LYHVMLTIPEKGGHTSMVHGYLVRSESEQEAADRVVEEFGPLPNMKVWVEAAVDDQPYKIATYRIKSERLTSRTDGMFECCALECSA